MKFALFALLVCLLSVWTVNAGCKKRLVKKFENCLKKGFDTSFENCEIGEPTLKKRQIRKCSRFEGRLKTCGYSCPAPDPVEEWTPIFNTTSDMIGPFSSIPAIRVNFTQHKEADKYLYQATNVNLYNGEGTKLAYVSFIFYARLNSENETQFTGYKRYYFDYSGPYSGKSGCSFYLTLDYLTGFEFEMVTNVTSTDMFQFVTPDGETNSESMEDCSSYAVWEEMLGEVEQADVKMTTWLEDLEDYFTTGYKVEY